MQDTQLPSATSPIAIVNYEWKDYQLWSPLYLIFKQNISPTHTHHVLHAWPEQLLSQG